MDHSAVTEPPAPGASVPLNRLIGFARFLRGNDFRVGVEEALDVLALARTVDFLDARQLRWGLKTLLCSCVVDWRRFDELFDAYWLGHRMRTAARVGGSAPRSPLARRAEPSRPERDDRRRLGPADGEGDAARATHGGASAGETLERTDFRHIDDPDEQRRVNDLVERLGARLRWRLTRRRRVRSRGRVVDIRNTIHRSLRHGGTPMTLAFRRRWPKPRRLVILLDASGSMAPYNAFFLRFIRGVVDHFADADAFAFHTRLVHVSHALREHDLEKAVERLTVMSAGWGGGTRIGGCLETFNRHYAGTVVNRRTVVIVVSDGYDTGAPELLAQEMTRLRRRAGRIVWLNPMMGWHGYEPTARGMAAALPHVDLLAPAHNLESLMALEPHLYRI
ncbi:MAG: VWA domain-containing protein [Alphaproteobacteria bacterium]